mmetsp:Transcript_6162/g.17211  ORF Transcript_6162/g.17211 Transcript_6162/m.17211 type:complete len:300 (-) Transcript_6162:492-1391(-)
MPVLDSASTTSTSTASPSSPFPRCTGSVCAVVAGVPVDPPVPPSPRSATPTVLRVPAAIRTLPPLRCLTTPMRKRPICRKPSNSLSRRARSLEPTPLRRKRTCCWTFSTILLPLQLVRNLLGRWSPCLLHPRPIVSLLRHPLRPVVLPVALPWLLSHLWALLTQALVLLLPSPRRQDRLLRPLLPSPRVLLLLLLPSLPQLPMPLVLPRPSLRLRPLRRMPSSSRRWLLCLPLLLPLSPSSSKRLLDSLVCLLPHRPHRHPMRIRPIRILQRWETLVWIARILSVRRLLLLSRTRLLVS